MPEFKHHDLALLNPSFDSPSAEVIRATQARTYQISKLVDAKMLIPTEPNARQYTVGFANSYLLRGVVATLRAGVYSYLLKVQAL